MNVEELLEMMEETLEAGTIVPFSASKRMVDVDRMRDIIDEVRNNLPDEIRESKKIVNDREQIMQNARIESESIIQQAEERARVLTSEQEIVKRSQQHAADILIVVEDIHRVVAAVVFVLDNLLCAQAEDEGIFLADLFYDLDVRTVHRAQGQRTV